MTPPANGEDGRTEREAIAPDADKDHVLPPGWRWRQTGDMVRRWPEREGSKLERITYAEAVECSCNGGWVEDEGWSQPYPRTPQERIPGEGLIPCGWCSDWDAPWPVEEANDG